MDKGIDGWNRWSDNCMDRWKDGYTCILTNGWTDECITVNTNRRNVVPCEASFAVCYLTAELSIGHVLSIRKDE